MPANSRWDLIQGFKVLKVKAFIFAFNFWTVLSRDCCSGAVLTELYTSLDIFPFNVICVHPITISLMNRNFPGGFYWYCASIFYNFFYSPLNIS